MVKHLINLFYPDLCTGCRAPLATGHEVVCIACRMQLPYTKFDTGASNPILKSFWGRVPLKGATALFYYQKHTVVQELLHAFKYRERTDIATHFGNELAKTAKMQGVFAGTGTVLVPVPMHKSKLKTRGYNQSELLAKELAQAAGLPVETNILFKETVTTSQTTKGRFDRWINSGENFAAVNTTHKHVVLVDDVITTGATIEACANALLKHNPELEISVVALAYTYR